MSHLGRPTEGEYEAKYSLQPVADYLTQHLGQTVSLVKDYLDSPFELQAGQVALLENVRFNEGEKANSDELAKRYAALADVFVMDAFGTAHRAQAWLNTHLKFALGHYCKES
jgi:phosphoglycerate kinase